MYKVQQRFLNCKSRTNVKLAAGSGQRAADSIVKLAAGSGFSSGFDCEVSSGQRMRIQAADSIVKLAAGSGCGFQQQIRL